MEKLLSISLSQMRMRQLMRLLVALSLIVLICVLYIIVKQVSSPLKPNSGRDLSMVNVIYNTAMPGGK